jgi:MazG family protein
MPTPPDNLREFDALIKVVEHLRGPQGCPWDKEQTHQTLTRFAIEEAFELSEAIDSGVKADIVEELGDLLLQVVLHAEIARQAGEFDIHDVIESISSKMVRRHPHVFGDVKVSGSGEVLKNWAEIKALEKSPDGPKPLSFDIPVGMPALIRSQKIGEKTEKINFDWGTPAEVLVKIEEEVAELSEAMDDNAALEKIESEIGDTLFSLAQLARHLNLDSEQALRKTNSRFESRFKKMQELVTTDGRDWAGLSASEREQYWQKAKSALKP